MNVTRIDLRIPLGYQIFEKSEKIDLYTASEILRTRKQNYITSVERRDDYAVITRHRLKCPYCGREFPAYLHFLRTICCASPKKSNSEILEWANIQLSFFGESNSVLKIQDFNEYSESFICPECGYCSRKTDDYANISIEAAENRVYVKREIKKLSELITTEWFEGKISVDFPVYECVVFDFESGITSLEIIRENDVLFCRNATDEKISFRGNISANLISKNPIIKRILKRLFEQISGYKIPFSVKELDFHSFINLTQFKGFPKNFYYAIPFVENAFVIDDTFKNIALLLKNPESAMRLLKDSSLPSCKSVKRLFATNSGLFFYLKECEFLYSIFNDVNLLCTLLQWEFVYTVLLRLHYYDGLKAFFADYSRTVGFNRLFDNLYKRNYRVFDYAVKYFSLNENAKKEEQKKWVENVNVFDTLRSLNDYDDNLSITMIPAPANIKNCVVGKYSFKTMKNRREYVEAGEKLKNCLVNWGAEDNPVIVVMTGEKMIAAMEIENGKILQARRKNNQTVFPESELYKAMEKWCKKFAIEINPEKLDGPFIR